MQLGGTYSLKYSSYDWRSHPTLCRLLVHIPTYKGGCFCVLYKLNSEEKHTAMLLVKINQAHISSKLVIKFEYNCNCNQWSRLKYFRWNIQARRSVSEHGNCASFYSHRRIQLVHTMYYPYRYLNVRAAVLPEIYVCTVHIFWFGHLTSGPCSNYRGVRATGFFFMYARNSRRN